MCDQVETSSAPTLIKLLVHAKEMGRVSNTGLIARNFLSNISPVYYGTPYYKFHPRDVYEEGCENWILYPEASCTVAEKIERGADPALVNLIVPDANWTQANHMTRKLLRSGSFTTVKLSEPRGGRYWLRLRGNHPVGVCTMEAVASFYDECGLPKISEHLRQGLEKFVYRSLKIRGKKEEAYRYLQTSRYTDFEI